MEYEVKKIREAIWSIEQRGVRSFLLVGEDSAILVDTCFEGNIKSVCTTLTDKPITLITTHSDPDHIGCDHQFNVQYMHPAEFDRYERRSKKHVNVRPMWEGDVFTVGNYKLEVVLVPGHTPGSIVLLEREHRFILSGDTVQNHCIYMHGDGRNIRAFRNSLEKLDRMRQEGIFETIYASHGATILSADIITEELALAENILNGTAVPAGSAPEHFPDTVKMYRQGQAQMYF